MIKTEENGKKDTTYVEDEYSSFLICKLLLDSFRNKDIDYFNYFKNNERHEFGYEQTVAITDIKEFEEYLKKKKNKKGKKGKYALHTACLACFSSYHEQYNNFSNCQ